MTTRTRVVSALLGALLLAGPLAPIAGAQQLEVRAQLLPGVLRAGDDDRQATALHHARVAADRRGQQRHAALLRGGAHGERPGGRDRRRVDDHPRRAVRRGQQALGAQHDLVEVLGAGDHREDDVAISQLSPTWS